MIKLDPTLVKQWRRFRKSRRSFWSLVVIGTLFAMSLVAELFCNNRPYVMRYQQHWYFPMVRVYPASIFSNDSTQALTDYRVMRESEAFKKPGNWMIFPPVPYHPNESLSDLGQPPPTPPDRHHWLGTDDRGRDLLVRLVYGFRNSMLFALISWAAIVAVAYTLGAAQGLIGGRFDFIAQRGTEIWSALPVLYVILFLLSVLPANLWLLGLVWVAFGWLSLSGYVRAEVLRVRKLDFVAAARALGVRTPGLLFRHVLPNALTPILTLSPFIISMGIATLAALDYLGLGLPPPAASWGELLRQGKENLRSWWLALFPFLSLFWSLLLLNFVGEGARTAFDAKSA